MEMTQDRTVTVAFAKCETLSDGSIALPHHSMEMTMFCKIHGNTAILPCPACRPAVIEKIVQQQYCDIDAADLAAEEIQRNPTWSNARIAAAVAQRILQP